MLESVFSRPLHDIPSTQGSVGIGHNFAQDDSLLSFATEEIVWRRRASEQALTQPKSPKTLNPKPVGEYILLNPLKSEKTPRLLA